MEINEEIRRIIDVLTNRLAKEEVPTRSPIEREELERIYKKGIEIIIICFHCGNKSRIKYEIRSWNGNEYRKAP